MLYFLLYLAVGVYPAYRTLQALVHNLGSLSVLDFACMGPAVWLLWPCWVLGSIFDKLDSIVIWRKPD